MPRRPRRALDEVAGPADPDVAPRDARAAALRRDFARRRADLEAAPRSPDGGGRLVGALLGAAVPDFAQWCLVDLVGAEGGVRRLARHAGCDLADDAHDACARSLVGLDDLLGATTSDSATRWINDERGTTGLVLGLDDGERPHGAVAFLAGDDARPYDAADVEAATDVVERVGVGVEHAQLRLHAREAVRQTQRLASQLHQLISASLTVATLHDEAAILNALAVSAQGVFEAEVALATLETGDLAPLEATARAGALPRVGVPALDEAPRARPGLRSAWIDGDWLVAPILEGRDTTRGVIAFRRASGASFGPEDREILTLLAQLAATALSATELTRGIERSEARLQVLVETAPVGIVEVDPGGRARWWNGPAARILNWPAFARVDEDLAPDFPAATHGALDDLWERVRGGAGPSDVDLDDVDVGTRRRQLTAAAALLPDTGDGRRGVLTLISDVTEGRQLRAELRHAHTMEVRGQVASRVAHDFNNLLTLISGYAEILSRELVDDVHATAMVRDIQATASRASLLTGQLQTIGRTKTPAPVVFNPVSVITSNAEVLERVLGSTIELLLSLDHHAGTVRADADQFEQMILNLAINARDAMPDGGHLRIGVGRATLDDEDAAARGVAPGDVVTLTVSDDGLGMDEETRRQCFEPLFTTKGAFRGTGMGLASAHRLVLESGGAIEVHSTPGSGTSFDIVLPRAGEAAEEDAAIATAPARPTASILLADDDEGLRRLMVQVLRRNGFQVEEADSGEAALAAAARMDPPPDLLVSDEVMGDLSGRELARELQGRRPDLRVLLVSGTASRDAVANLRDDASDFLAKPFKPSELIDRVNRLLASRGAGSRP